VALPEGGEGKINSAYAIGGPHYAELAVAGALGVPINYYAVLKFSGFKDLVDALGGVTIDVKTAIDDPTYPADVGYGYKPLHIPAGVQHMDGTVALEYVRTRHDDPRGDIGRNARQQDVLLALQRQALTPATLLRLPAVLGALQNAVQMDFPYNRLPDLVSIIGHARGHGITRDALTPEAGEVSVSTSWDGQWIFQPNWPAINAHTARLFADPRLGAEHAAVAVQNGTPTPGLARMLGVVLQRDGFTIAGVTQAAGTDHPTTEVIVHDPAVAYSGRALASMLHASLSQAPAASQTAGSTTPQLTVIVGDDFPGAGQ
jgi:LCP family protein required for cell wall assembly